MLAHGFGADIFTVFIDVCLFSDYVFKCKMIIIVRCNNEGRRIQGAWGGVDIILPIITRASD